ncbi:MAG: hypothetical protein E6J53_09460 [Chloroflexi bacterium]|nr:MAG: hypothetical protein E6J53_09460 [Chloroflexota bacterium]
MNGKPEDRVDKIVSDLLRGRRLKLRGGDAEEKEAITAAARLAGDRAGPQRMNPAFRNRLAQALEQAPQGSWLTRRGALVAGFGLAAGAVSGAVIGRAVESQPYAVDRTGAINPLNGKWIDVAAVAELVEGQGRRVTAARLPLSSRDVHDGGSLHLPHLSAARAQPRPGSRDAGGAGRGARHGLEAPAPPHPRHL